VKLSTGILLMGAIAFAGCGGGGSVTVGPTGTIEDNFFVTWEIDSTAFGAIACAEAGASDVDMDVVNVDTGNRFVFSFVCDAFQGTSGPVDVGTFDVLLNLVDPSGGVIDQVDVGVQNVTTAGTIDLGHAIFRVP
jgi:hypothetical protein